MRLFHYTDEAGFKAIKANPDWVFKASRPAAAHPQGAYFTDLIPDSPSLACRLRIPREKIAYYFCFEGNSGLKRLRGGRGKYILYSPVDYTVKRSQQKGHGKTDEWVAGR